LSLKNTSSSAVSALPDTPAMNALIRIRDYYQFATAVASVGGGTTGFPTANEKGGPLNARRPCRILLSVSG
jgi:hypothetical protein